ncbi:CoA ester lyase [Pseudoruegeria sp. SK021]|uniref:HpcH/HpaI aldolase/citrate lyase family protein n=1 Tax=Pseudoruegeria sp. SK021 TaxID=1933035 RepID=UPI000A229E2A|nr:CoA ester lyase [Pseudoruegeria sp. SK021]OSP56102.1 CoA ester lyase [Pseudoruegeria sp. SK021]
MDHANRPYRSVLYIPAANERALEKAKSLPADAIIFDLEDAVSVDAKVAARALLVSALQTGGYGQRSLIIRINGMDSAWGAADFDAVAALGPQAILVPKVGSAQEIADLAAKLDAIPACAATQIWAMMETPQGILNAASIATAPRMGGFVMGTNDLNKELMATTRPDREPLLMSLQFCLLAARAAGITIVDGVYNAFKDEDGLALECGQGRDMGFDGKSLIHPTQISIANAAFAPSPEDIELAQRQITAFEAAEVEGKGIAVLDGRIVENLHVATARQTLAKARAIEILEAS